MLIAGKMMWAEIVNANCSRASTRTSLVSSIRVVLRHPAARNGRRHRDGTRVRFYHSGPCRRTTQPVGRRPASPARAQHLRSDEFRLLMQAVQAEIQTKLFFDYRINIESYPKWPRWMRDKHPPLLVLWGRHDLSF